MSEIFKNLCDPLKFLHPGSYGNNPLDRKIFWIFVQFLMEDLQKNNNIFESFMDVKINFSMFYLRLTRNFVSQLEILGLWDLAVLLLVHFPENFISIQNKNRWIQSIIHRNYLENVTLFSFTI